MIKSMNNLLLWCVSILALLIGGIALYTTQNMAGSMQASLLDVPSQGMSTMMISKGGQSGGGGGGPYGGSMMRGSGGTFDYVDINDGSPVFSGKIFSADPVTGDYNAILHHVSHDPLILDLPVIVKDNSGNLWAPMQTPTQ